MLVGLVSAKGAPGVTSAALALTAVSGGVMVELDPSGGSVDCWLTATGEPGLIPAASALRRQADPEVLLGLATELVPGVRVIRAPTPGPLADSTVKTLHDRLLPTLAALDTTVIVDGGRWARSQSTARRITGCDVAAVVCSPTVEGVEAARNQIDHVARFVDEVAVVAVGDRPYSPEEVAEVVQVPVAVLAWDRRGLARVLDGGTGKGWQRTALARSARSVLDQLYPARPASRVDDGGQANEPVGPASETGVARA